MDKRTAAPLSGRAAPQGVDGSDETDKGTCPEKGVPEADGTGQAVQEVRGCDYPSCLPVVKLAPVPDTGKNGGAKNDCTASSASTSTPCWAVAGAKTSNFDPGASTGVKNGSP